MTVLLVVIVLLLLWYCGCLDKPIAWVRKNVLGECAPAENYGPCRYCDSDSNYRVPRNGTLVLNPYVWPYSGTQNVNDLYILNKDVGTDFNFECGPLTQLSAPDHVILSN